MIILHLHIEFLSNFVLFLAVPVKAEVSLPALASTASRRLPAPFIPGFPSLFPLHSIVPGVKKPAKHQRSKQTGYDLCWKVLNPGHLLFHAHRLCMHDLHNRNTSIG